MNSIANKSDLSMDLLYKTKDFASLFKWIESIPNSQQQPQNYLVIAVFIQENIEPIIRKREPLIDMEGDVLPPEFTQSKGFIDQRKNVLPSVVDPAFLPLLNSDKIPLKESIVLVKAEERVSKISKAVLLICHIDKDETNLKSFCEGAIEEISSMRNNIRGSFSISAQALISDSPPFSRLANSTEALVFAGFQDSINQSIEKIKQPVLDLKPKEGLILQKHLDYGKIEKTNTKLSFKLNDDKITTTKDTNTVELEFTEVRFESTDLITLQKSK